MMTKLILVTATLLCGHAFADSTRTLCDSDNRRPSDVPEVGRIVETAGENVGCSGTLISKSCFITAGHCAHIFNYVQFNVPGDNIHPPRTRDVYKVDKSSIEEGNGSDWAVGRLLPNSYSHKHAGDVQGWLKVRKTAMARGRSLAISGYGDSPRGFVQQIAYGKVVEVSASQLEYQVDTMPGNSGSGIVDSSTEAVIGIHTNGGCGPSAGNTGTPIAGNLPLQKAIARCLAR